MASKWTGPGDYMKRPGEAIATLTKHGLQENCWVGSIEGRAVIAYQKRTRAKGSSKVQDCLVIFDNPEPEPFRGEADER